MSAKPIRLQLSRRKGFNLQAASRAANGLEAVNVARPGMWGNPFVIHPHHAPGRVWRSASLEAISVPTAEDAVECYREMMSIETPPDARAAQLRALLHDLRGKNLACWCKATEPCHADVLLEIANAPICEAATHPARAQDMGDEG